MSYKAQQVIFWGLIFGLLGFAHSVRCSDMPALSNLTGWLTLCTSLYYFAHQDIRYHMPDWDELKVYFLSNEAFPYLSAALLFTAFQHVMLFLDQDAYLAESIVAGLFLIGFYVTLYRELR